MDADGCRWPSVGMGCRGWFMMDGLCRRVVYVDSRMKDGVYVVGSRWLFEASHGDAADPCLLTFALVDETC